MPNVVPANGHPKKVSDQMIVYSSVVDLYHFDPDTRIRIGEEWIRELT